MPTSTVDDLELAYWKTFLGKSGSLNSLRYEGYGQLAGMTTGTVIDRERKYLISTLGLSAAVGAATSLEDLRKQHRIAALSNEAATDTAVDLDYKFWQIGFATSLPTPTVAASSKLTSAGPSTVHSWSGLTFANAPAANRIIQGLIAVPVENMVIFNSNVLVNGNALNTVGFGSTYSWKAVGKTVSIIPFYQQVAAGTTWSLQATFPSAVSNVAVMVFDTVTVSGFFDFWYEASGFVDPGVFSVAASGSAKVTMAASYDDVSAGLPSFSTLGVADAIDLGGKRLAAGFKASDARATIAETVDLPGTATANSLHGMFVLTT